MLGSTIVSSKSRSRLKRLASDLDEIDGFDRVELQVLTSIDFELHCSKAKVAWSSGKPVVFDEAGGLAVLPISVPGLVHMLELKKGLTREEKADLSRLRAFVQQHGERHLYEVTSF